MSDKYTRWVLVSCDALSSFTTYLSTTTEKSGQIKYVVNDVPVQIIAERVQYLDQDGKLVTKSFAQFSQENLQKVYPTLDAFLQKWGSTVHKQAVLVELLQHGVMLDELRERIGEEYDPFDMICHIAYDRPALTRQERARKVQKQDVFSEFHSRIW